MKKPNFRVSEVITFVEGKIQDNTASEKELVLYQDYKWDGVLKAGRTYKELVSQMNREYEGF